MPGKMTTIISESTDVTAFAVPYNKLFDITRIQINNRANDDIRVRGWDSFTDTDGTARLEEVFDYPVASLDAIVVDCADDSKRVMGTLVLQGASDSTTAISSNVFVYVGGKYPF